MEYGEGQALLGHIFWDTDYLPLLGIKMLVCLGIFVLIRLLVRVLTHEPASALFSRQNTAFGLSLAGLILGVAIVLASTIYGDIKENMVLDTLLMTMLYGGLGVGLMLISRLVFDRLALPGISIKQEIADGNLSAGMIDAANMVATAIIISAVMLWVPHNSIDGLLSVLIGYVFSQIVLVAMTHLRVWLLRVYSRGDIRDFNTLLHADNIALAARFAGHRLGTGFAVMAAVNVIMYQADGFFSLFISWVVASFVLVVIIECLDWLACRIVFWGVDVRCEVQQHNNLAIGITQGTLYASLGLLVAQLLT